MKEERKKILFDSVSFHFSISVFVYQFLLNLTYPLLLPVSFYCYGWTFLYSQGFALRSLPSLVFGYLIPIAFYLTIICVFISTDYIGYQSLFQIFLYVTHRLMVAFKYATLSPTEYRRIMRGHNIRHQEINYSHYPTQEEIETVQEYQIQLQLLTGWLPINNYRIIYEFVAASLICVADISSSILIPDPNTSIEHDLQFNRWKNLLTRHQLSDHLIKDNEKNVWKIDLLTFCNCVMLENRNVLTGLSPLVILLSIINAVIPLFFVGHRFIHLNTYAQIYYISSGIVSLVFYWALCGFLLAALEDSMRRYLCSMTLSHFIRVIDVDSRFRFRLHGDGPTKQLFHCESTQLQQAMNETTQFRSSVSDPSSSSFHSTSSLKNRKTHSFEISSSSAAGINSTLSIPQNPLLSTSSLPSSSSPITASYADPSCKTLPILNFADYPDNIIVWIYARKLLHNFGNRIRFRLDTYCGGIILLVLTLIISVFYIIFTSPHPSSSSSSSRVDSLSSPGFIQLILWIVVFTLFQAVMIALGHFTNKTMESHGYILSQHVLLLTREINQLNEQKNLPDNYPQLSLINKRLETLETSLTTMKNTLTACEVMDFVQPVRVLGIKCEGRTAVVIVYTLFLFLVGILQYVYSGSFSFGG